MFDTPETGLGQTQGVARRMVYSVLYHQGEICITPPLYGKIKYGDLTNGLERTPGVHLREFEIVVLQPTTPWRTQFSAHALREGMLIPLESEVEWQLPEGPLPYWRRSITEVAYEFAR